MWQLVVGALGKAFTSWNTGRTEIKKAKLQTKLASETAKQRRFEAQINAESSWDLAALRAAERSWKDEWLTIILTAPFVGAFIPVVQDYVVVGFEYIQKTPGWYQLSFLGIIAASFGLRWLIGGKMNPMNILKK